MPKWKFDPRTGEKLEEGTQDDKTPKMPPYDALKALQESLGVEMRWNQFTNEAEVKTPNPGIWQTESEEAYADIVCAVLKANIPGLTTEKQAAFLDGIARERRYHPVKEYLEGLEWDGTPRRSPSGSSSASPS